MNNGNWDYIIIGAGASGCVIANRLSENPQNKVLLLEAGPKDRGLQFRVPVLQSQSVNNQKYDWQYQRDSGDFPFGQKNHLCNAGKVLGGGTAINGLVYVRGAPQDYDYWELLGNNGWSYNDVLPYFKKAETNALLHPLAGTDGPMHVVTQQNPPVLSTRMIEAATELGIPHCNPLDNAGKVRAIYFQTNQKNGVRCSSAYAYLSTIRNRKNLHIIINAHVTKLILKNKKVIGVEYQIEKNKFTVDCEKEVIVSGGALSSPKILLLFGIGDSYHFN